jgi:hypothetical protein
MQYAVCSYWLLKTLNEGGVLDGIIRLKYASRTLILMSNFAQPDACLHCGIFFSGWLADIPAAGLIWLRHAKQVVAAWLVGPFTEYISQCRRFPPLFPCGAQP